MRVSSWSVLVEWVLGIIILRKKTKKIYIHTFLFHFHIFIIISDQVDVNKAGKKLISQLHSTPTENYSIPPNFREKLRVMSHLYVFLPFGEWWLYACYEPVGFHLCTWESWADGLTLAVDSHSFHSNVVFIQIRKSKRITCVIVECMRHIICRMGMGNISFLINSIQA